MIKGISGTAGASEKEPVLEHSWLARMPGPSAGLVNAVTGFGDKCSLGATSVIRDVFDIDGGVDKDSDAYKGGEIAGAAALVVLPLTKGAQMVAKGGQAAVKGGELAIKDRARNNFNISRAESSAPSSKLGTTTQTSGPYNASNPNAQAALNTKMRALSGAQKDAVKIQKFSDGRIRYIDV
jgi:hypothetical protein